jgi:hypothetical protein
MTGLEISNINLEKRLQSAYDTVQKQKLDTDAKIREGLRPMEESNEFLRKNFPDMMSMALSFKRMNLTDKTAIEKTMLHEINKNDTEKAELRKENTILRVKLDLLSNKKEKFNPNEITIKGDKKHE